MRDHGMHDRVYLLPSLASLIQEPIKESVLVFLCIITASIFSSPLVPTVGSKKEEGFELHHAGKITMYYILCTFFKTGF